MAATAGGADPEELLEYDDDLQGQHDSDAVIRQMRVSALGRNEIISSRPKHSKVLLKARYVSRQLEMAPVCDLVCGGYGPAVVARAGMMILSVGFSVGMTSLQEHDRVLQLAL